MQEQNSIVQPEHRLETASRMPQRLDWGWYVAQRWGEIPGPGSGRPEVSCGAIPSGRKLASVQGKVVRADHEHLGALHPPGTWKPGGRPSQPPTQSRGSLTAPRGCLAEAAEVQLAVCETAFSTRQLDTEQNRKLPPFHGTKQPYGYFYQVLPPGPPKITCDPFPMLGFRN